MRVAEEILRDLQQAFAGRAAPRVRALRLPRQAALGSKDGEFGAIELEDGSVGLSYVLLGDTLPALQPGGRLAVPAGTDALALAATWAGTDPALQAIGFAAVNALTRHLFDRAKYVPPPARDSIAGLAPVAGEHVGMIGLFPPLVAHVLRGGAKLTVLELRPELEGPREGYTVTLNRQALAGSDKILSTSTILLNASFDQMLAVTRGAAVFALVGPGAGCLPDALFRRGVTTVAGSWITDPAGLCTALESGGPWGGFARKFTLERSDYPGLPALLVAAARA